MLCSDFDLFTIIAKRQCDRKLSLINLKRSDMYMINACL